MKVAIEARALSRPASGVRTYVGQLLAALRRLESEHEYTILDRGPGTEALWPLWLNTSVPRWLTTVGPDVVHFTKAALPRRKMYPTVVTIYDVIPLLFPQSQKLLPRLLWPATLRHAASSADHILTISEASKRDIIERLQVASEKVTVTPLAVDIGIRNPNFAQGLRWARQESRIKNMTDTPYILFLSTLEPRKNVPALVRAFAKISALLPHMIYIAGRSYKGGSVIEQEIVRHGLQDRVKLLGTVPAEDLTALYKGADLFVLPSVYEGWSFPVQEAMVAGVPVIVSNGGALPEVVGEAGEVVPFTVDTIVARKHDEAFEVALADRMLQVLSDAARQASMREAGFKQVQKFSWDQVARTTLQVYESVAKLQ